MRVVLAGEAFSRFPSGEWREWCVWGGFWRDPDCYNGLIMVYTGLYIVVYAGLMVVYKFVV